MGECIGVFLKTCTKKNALQQWLGRELIIELMYLHYCYNAGFIMLLLCTMVMSATIRKCGSGICMAIYRPVCDENGKKYSK